MWRRITLFVLVLAHMIEHLTDKFVDLHHGTPRLQRAYSQDASSVLIAGRGSHSVTVLAALQREYSLREALNARWSAVPRSLIPYGEGTVLIISDPGGEPLPMRSYANQLDAFFKLAIGLASAVEAMHSAGIIHRALTPSRCLSNEDGSIYLTGFGFAARDSAADENLNDEGWAWDHVSLVYMAPELSGRMNVRVDTRADLYSLGCILYEMLTGEPPFSGTDMSTLIHAHATHRPQAPSVRDRRVPETVSEIVLKLLEKAPEQRYETASALLADLRAAQKIQITAEHHTSPLRAANPSTRRDSSYANIVVGREQELHALLDAYDHVANANRMQAAWVSGHSGIGKSTLLREALTHISRQHSPLIVTGACIEARQGVPYAALTQALEQLLQSVLGSLDSEFSQWRDRLRSAAGSTYPILATLIPSLATVLGAQPELIAKAEDTVYERETVLQGIARLISCFSSSIRPLVLALDDLQWADVGTLHVLERLLLQHDDSAIFLIGAFREREVGAEHPLRTSLMDARGTALTLTLGPLDRRALHELVSCALQHEDSLIPLTNEIASKTDGNPFFVHQLLRVLSDESLPHTDMNSETWRRSIDRIAANRGLNSVVELLTHRLESLPASTREVLQFLSCLGSHISTHALAVVCSESQCYVVDNLSAALDAGILHHEGPHWSFCHDRIRETVYASIPEEARPCFHLCIVRRQRAAAIGDFDVFSIADQANLAQRQVTSDSERRAFALLNLDVGRQAKKATAHHSALRYFRAAQDFLGEYDQSADGLTARMLCGEAEFMTGALDSAEARLSTLEPIAGNGVFGAKLTRLRLALYTTLGRFDLALEAGLSFLRKVGIDVPTTANTADVDREYALLRHWIDEHGIEGFRHLPTIIDPQQKMIFDIVGDMLPPAMYTSQELVDMLLLRAANLAIEYGHSDSSPNVYVCMNLVFGMRYGDYAATRSFGELALFLVHERGLTRQCGRVYHTYGTFVIPWTAPARSARDYIRKAYDISVEAGDQTFAVYCRSNETSCMLFSGEFLGDIRETISQGLSIAEQANFELVIRSLQAKWALLLQLQDGHQDDQPLWPAEPLEGAPTTLVDVAYWVHRLQAALLFGDIPQALEARRRAHACEDAARSFPERADLQFYGALALLELPGRNAEEEAALQQHMALLKTWAQACPENFSARYDLVRAELARTQGHIQQAGDAYIQAMQWARRYQITHIEALSAELAARFYADRSDTVASRAYLRHARHAWQRWGASAKARDLLAHHPEIEDMNNQPDLSSRLDTLDVQAVLRISTALASDIVPERFIETLLRTALENAGAEKGVLVLLRDGKWIIPAQAKVVVGEILTTQTSTAFSSEVLPVSLVQVVARTQAGVVIDDAHELPAYRGDDYIQRQRPRSVLCVPLMRYSALAGVLYLENSLAPNVFTPAKAALLEVVTTQAAFGLENARLYDALREQNEKRAQAEEQLRNALDDLTRASRLKAMGELVGSIVHEVGQPLSAVNTSAGAALRWLDRSPPNIAEARDMLETISRSADRAKTIVQGLRARAKRTEPEFVLIDLAETLREAAALIAGQLDALGVKLELHGIDREIFVVGDRIQLQQVAINLMINGAEAMAGCKPDTRILSLCCMASPPTASCSPTPVFADKKEGSPQSDMALTESCSHIHIVVDDQGSGIDPKVANRLLEPMFTTKATGMGMGLSISHSIIQAHGGTLTLSMREEGGTRASITLPISAPTI